MHARGAAVSLVLLGLVLSVVVAVLLAPIRRIKIAPETTAATEPLADDGYPDYLAALNQHCAEGVKPETNAAVLFWEALGPAGITPKHRKAYFAMLGIAPLPEEGEYLTRLQEYLQSRRGQQPESTVWDRLRELQEQVDRARRKPWSADDYPVLAEWIEANEKPLEIAQRGTRRSWNPRFFLV